MFDGCGKGKKREISHECYDRVGKLPRLQGAWNNGMDITPPVFNTPGNVP